MTEQIRLSQGEYDAITQIVQLAARKAQNGVYMHQGHSRSLSCPTLLIVALGEQALALQQIIMKAAIPDELSLIERPVVREFGNNGDFDITGSTKRR